MRVGGGQQELDVGRGFFKGLEQRVKAAGRQHVHLIDEIHLITPLGRRILHVIEQLAGVFDLGPRGGIHFDQVDKTPFVDGLAAIALAARRRRHALVAAPVCRAVKALGEDACKRGLADTAGTGKQVGVMQTALVKGIDQGALYMGLAHKLVKCSRPPFTGQNLIAH
ncbi:MAG: hypothetical protein HLUCCA13_10730 [Halomonas sp. HL-48]|nr:MAG: hypothetical protein HLUCCA13_10730 [Halomonas sp. HL-48]